MVRESAGHDRLLQQQVWLDAINWRFASLSREIVNGDSGPHLNILIQCPLCRSMDCIYEYLGKNLTFYRHPPYKKAYETRAHLALITFAFACASAACLRARRSPKRGQLCVSAATAFLCIVVCCVFACGRTEAQVLAYSNITADTGQGIVAGGATANSLSPGVAITQVVADDISVASGTPGQRITQWTLIEHNFDPTTSFSAEPKIRIWDDNGPGGGPGTFLFGVTATTPVVYSANSNFVDVIIFNTPDTPFPGFVIPADGRFWAGVQFDNNNGSTATVEQLNELGVEFYNPPTVGSSADLYFRTSGPQGVFGFFGVSNPPGTLGTNETGNSKFRSQAPGHFWEGVWSYSCG